MDKKVALFQGIYFFITGIWPISSMGSFLISTDPKTVLWLVKRVGPVLATNGALLIYAQVIATINPPVIELALGSALSLVLMEFIYVFKRVISPG